MAYRMTLIAFAALILCIAWVDPSFCQINFLPCYNTQCQPGYEVVQQYDRSCLCVPIGAPPKCDTTVCGIGFKPVMQTNGSCMCVAVDCTSESGCFEPPKIRNDCTSIEGCKPPKVIEP
ncbi:MAG: hypothetical protein ABFD12_10305 [Syntrophorhabdus sp.]